MDDPDQGDVQVTPARRQPVVTRLAIYGVVIGWIGFLALTGAACAEGLITAVVAAAVGMTWAALGHRLGWSRAATAFSGVLVIIAVTLAASLIGHSLAPRLIFRRAFGVPPPAAVRLIESHRFGFSDNTALLILQTDQATLTQLLNGAGFKPRAEAEEELHPSDDHAVTGADRERSFRNKVSGGGVFADKLPFNPDLKVYQRSIPNKQSPETKITVTWDPKQQKAYVFVAEY